MRCAPAPSLGAPGPATRERRHKNSAMSAPGTNRRSPAQRPSPVARAPAPFLFRSFTALFSGGVSKRSVGACTIGSYARP